MSSLQDFSARSIDGRDVPLSDFDGQVVLVVNTASQCGFTPQYQGLQQLHDDFGAKGFSQQGGLLGSKIKWNFTKYLLGKDGRVIARYSPTTRPEKITADIEKALAV